MPGWSNMEDKGTGWNWLGRLMLRIPPIRRWIFYQEELYDLRGYFRKYERILRDQTRRGRRQERATEDLVRLKEITDNDWYLLP